MPFFPQWNNTVAVSAVLIIVHEIVKQKLQYVCFWEDTRIPWTFLLQFYFFCFPFFVHTRCAPPVLFISFIHRKTSHAFWYLQTEGSLVKNCENSVTVTSVSILRVFIITDTSKDGLCFPDLLAMKKDNHRKSHLNVIINRVNCSLCFPLLGYFAQLHLSLSKYKRDDLCIYNWHTWFVSWG